MLGAGRAPKAHAGGFDSLIRLHAPAFGSDYGLGEIPRGGAKPREVVPHLAVHQRMGKPSFDSMAGYSFLRDRFSSVDGVTCNTRIVMPGYSMLQVSANTAMATRSGSSCA